MSNPVLERIKRQTEENFQFNKIDQVVLNVTQQQNQIPLSTQELQSTLEKLFIVEEKLVEPVIAQIDDLSFPDLFHFCEWYLNHKDGFTEIQQRALGTLVEARDLINVGCACKRQQRLDAALNYFKIFWENNMKNDLIPTVLKLSSAKKIVFGDFLQFP